MGGGARIHSSRSTLIYLTNMVSRDKNPEPLSREALGKLSTAAQADHFRKGGALLPEAEAEPVTPYAGVGLGRYTKDHGFKSPGEVAEPERRSAEDQLVKLLGDFCDLRHPVIKEIWWTNNAEKVVSLAKKETRRSHNWIALFVTQYPAGTAPHVSPGGA
jgi:hypothetical protein